MEKKKKQEEWRGKTTEDKNIHLQGQKKTKVDKLGNKAFKNYKGTL